MADCIRLFLALVACGVFPVAAFAQQPPSPSTSPAGPILAVKIEPPRAPKPQAAKTAPTEEQAEPVGDVVATFRDGTTQKLSTGGNASMVKLSTDGTIGWTLNKAPTKTPGDGYGMSYEMRPNGTLVLYRDGKVTTQIKSKLVFIEAWEFVDNGRKVALRTRQSHGPGFIQLFESASGKELATVSENTPRPPAWAKALIEG